VSAYIWLCPGGWEVRHWAVTRQSEETCLGNYFRRIFSIALPFASSSISLSR
jgi:hypothetical protein